jgi:hypothetical protein
MLLSTGQNDTRHALDAMIADLPGLKQRCDAANSIYSKCRSFIDALPEDAVLETVEVKTDDRSLEEERTRRKAAEDELKILHAMPTSSSDIETRIRDFALDGTTADLRHRQRRTPQSCAK